MVGATYRERKVAVDLQARLIEPPFAGEHPARQQERLRLGPGLGEAARHKQGVETFLARWTGAQWRRSTM